jgi:antitoxin (DNA-binding transcriptional repressor) of toxin-antitoxin stability system
MSTLTLKNLPATVERLQAMIRAGKSVRITDGGRTVATLEPSKAVKKSASAARQRIPKTRESAAEWLEKNLPPGPGMPDFDVGEWLRKAREAEG